MTRTLSLPLPHEYKITMEKITTTVRRFAVHGIASAQNYGKLSVRVWLASIPAIFFASVAVARAATVDAILANPLNKALSTVPDFIAGVLKAIVLIAPP